MRTSLNKAENTEVQGALERFRAFLRAKELRTTAEREAIVRAVVVSKGHFDIDELVKSLKLQGVAASRATVYRALPLLVEAGVVQPTVLTGARRRYETALDHEHHDHLICTVCGSVVEFHFEAFEVLQRDLATRHGFELTSHVHELLGICSSCRSTAKRSH